MQHRELVKFCKTFSFERMGAFAYSEEDGTPAASLPDQVQPDSSVAPDMQQGSLECNCFRVPLTASLPARSVWQHKAFKYCVFC